VLSAIYSSSSRVANHQARSIVFVHAFRYGNSYERSCGEAWSRHFSRRLFSKGFYKVWRLILYIVPHQVCHYAWFCLIFVTPPTPNETNMLSFCSVVARTEWDLRPGHRIQECTLGMHIIINDDIPFFFCYNIMFLAIELLVSYQVARMILVCPSCSIHDSC